jgi:hypothetical protein
MKKLLLHSFIAGAALAGMAGCAQVKKPEAQVKAAAVGSRFDQVGRVTLYAGEPCTSQIMFDFHGAGSTVWLAGPRNETEILTDAAKKTWASIFGEDGDVADNQSVATLKSRARS